MAGMLLGEYAAMTGVQCVGLDTSVDPMLLGATLSANLAVQGNLDPLALLAGGAALETEARSILAALRTRPHIFNLGHGILPQTPPEHVADLLHLLRAA